MLVLSARDLAAIARYAGLLKLHRLRGENTQGWGRVRESDGLADGNRELRILSRISDFGLD